MILRENLYYTTRFISSKQKQQHQSLLII